jgi:hypothetical protein
VLLIIPFSVQLACGAASSMRSPHPKGTKRAEKGRFGALSTPSCLMRAAIGNQWPEAAAVVAAAAAVGSSSSGGTAAATATGGSAESAADLQLLGRFASRNATRTKERARNAPMLLCERQPFMYKKAIWA